MSDELNEEQNINNRIPARLLCHFCPRGFQIHYEARISDPVWQDRVVGEKHVVSVR